MQEKGSKTAPERVPKINQIYVKLDTSKNTERIEKQTRTQVLKKGAKRTNQAGNITRATQPTTRPTPNSKRSFLSQCTGNH